jgi:drug efflux transport system ATP-binding protein
MVNNTPAVVLRSVTKVFHEGGQPDVTAVNDLTLTIERGEIFCLVGPDGAGKTTTLRMMCGVLLPTQGEIEIAGLSMKRDRQAIKNRIGYLSQRFSLYGDLTIDENIDFFAQIHKVEGYQDRKQELLEFMRLSAFHDRLADRLSGGMKQKLALACTLIHRPEVIFLDEPTTGVDPVSRRDFWKILSSVLKSGISIVMATPYLDEAERSSRVALMNQGTLLGCDSPEHVKASFTSTVLEVVCEDPRAAMEIARHHRVQESVQLFGDRLHVVLKERAASADDFLADLRKGGTVISSSRIISPSLEDVFISRITS